MLEYQPLSSENHEIRLLTLTGGERSAFVTCELKHYSLIDHPPYTSLSYCWGNPDITKTIIVNGVKFQATVNLESALRQLQADGFTNMWVDAICINQNDREERSRQVLRMKRIYTEASDVVVWLGLETESSKATMSYIELLTQGKMFKIWEERNTMTE
ncbi:Heterokaryon incompatibility protein [Hyphodiscus hymeniophilus]|uniref:Heterokaryon incompatibility protein n=1 Tax=Hyphodiscus hymeniophilus TaxID=353542 RepID=A0A9P7B1A3_9HELO|nr:Heterokaryon incompatibility protein [Hyphodiscus hymeniophilus]